MENNIERFEINGFSVGIDDKNDVIEGKENDYIAVCTELWNYLTSDEFFDSVSAEKDYVKMSEPYERCMSCDNILIPMECLDDYCDNNSIGIASFLDNMDHFFRTYHDYFVDSSQYISGNILADFDIDMTDICRAIISRPYPLVRYDRKIEDEKLLTIFEKMKNCLNLE